MAKAKNTEQLPNRRILVQQENKNFILEIPADIRLTFGPWSPPNSREPSRYAEGHAKGTLRLYKGATTAQNILATYTGVISFRDLDQIIYHEQHSLPLCRLCKSNLVIPGEDLCASCSGAKPEPEEIFAGEMPSSMSLPKRSFI